MSQGKDWFKELEINMDNYLCDTSRKKLLEDLKKAGWKPSLLWRVREYFGLNYKEDKI